MCCHLYPLGRGAKGKEWLLWTTSSPSSEHQLARSRVEFKSWLTVKQCGCPCFIWQNRFTPRSSEAIGTRDGGLEIKSYIGIIVVSWNHTVLPGYCRDFQDNKEIINAVVIVLGCSCQNCLCFPEAVCAGITEYCKSKPECYAKSTFVIYFEVLVLFWW